MDKDFDTMRSEVWGLRCVVKNLVKRLDIDETQKEHLMAQLETKNSYPAKTRTLIVRKE